MVNSKVSIIIVSYNVRAWLIQCLVSVDLYCKSNYEVIVVDNHSTDSTVKTIRKQFPFVKIIANDSNPGFSKANNQGMMEAEGEYFFLLNPDTELIQNIIPDLEKYCRENNNKVIVAPRLLNSDRSLQLSCYHFPTLLNIVLEAFYLHTTFGKITYPDNDHQNINKVDGLSGAALFFHRSLFEMTMGLDENLFWMEDIDFCRRAKNCSCGVFYYPDTVLIHHSGKSSKENFNVAISNQLLSKLKFVKKYNSKILFVFASIFIFLHILSRIVALGLLSFLQSRYKEKFTAYLFSFKKYFSYLFDYRYSLT